MDACPSCLTALGLGDLWESPVEVAHLLAALPFFLLEIPPRLPPEVPPPTTSEKEMEHLVDKKKKNTMCALYALSPLGARGVGQGV